MPEVVDMCIPRGRTNQVEHNHNDLKIHPKAGWGVTALPDAAIEYAGRTVMFTRMRGPSFRISRRSLPCPLKVKRDYF